MESAIFGVQYIGSIEYYALLLQSAHVYIDTQEKWEKQTYKSRTYIDSPNGKLALNIPIIHNGAKTIDKILISYTENWPNKHRQALLSSYSKSPFYDIIAPSIFNILDKRPEKLLDLNLLLMKEILFWLKADLNLLEKSESTSTDYRRTIHPKKDFILTPLPYPQVFDDRSKFKTGLSVLDLLFNEGPTSKDYLLSL